MYKLNGSTYTEIDYTWETNSNLLSDGESDYTYNTAGFLTSVETNTSTADWELQAEILYDGLGNRLEMTAYADGQGITTRYTLDAGRVLAAASAESSTFYLYGTGPIGELTDNWSYPLTDGSGTQRQRTDANGLVTLTTTYTPWGDLLDVRGEGSFTYGYFGGVMDNVTGLLWRQWTLMIPLPDVSSTAVPDPSRPTPTSPALKRVLRDLVTRPGCSWLRFPSWDCCLAKRKNAANGSWLR